MFRHVSWVLLSVFAVVGCGNSLVVAEQQKRLDASDGGEREQDGGEREQGVICGQVICKDKTVTLSGTDIPGFACCSDPVNSVCGLVELAVTCIALNQPGRLDMSCPSAQNTPLGVLPGCCRPDNTCGVYDSVIGFGCAQIPAFPVISPLTKCTY
jgi:hypothetical protein